jgi:SAM-dependent methyltransferase
MTAYDPSWIRRYYDSYGMKEWTRWDVSPVERVKFQIHRHYLDAYISSSDRVLEIGAGAGRFTQHLASVADRIVVADISPGQLALNRDHASRYAFAGKIEAWVECDMCDLQSEFPAASFDSVVCYGGPLSYVFEAYPRALDQMKRVMKPGGSLLLSVMSLWGTVHQFLPGVLEVDAEANRRILRSGDLTTETVGPDRHYTHMFRASELQQALGDAGLEIVALSASNCLATGWGERLSEVSEGCSEWRQLIEMEIEACRQPGCLDMGTHMIAVCRKPA